MGKDSISWTERVFCTSIIECFYKREKTCFYVFYLQLINICDLNPNLRNGVQLRTSEPADT